MTQNLNSCFLKMNGVVNCTGDIDTGGYRLRTTTGDIDTGGYRQRTTTGGIDTGGYRL
jgi:hypothetical protein